MVLPDKAKTTTNREKESRGRVSGASWAGETFWPESEFAADRKRSRSRRVVHLSVTRNRADHRPCHLTRRHRTHSPGTGRAGLFGGDLSTPRASAREAVGQPAVARSLHPPERAVHQLLQRALTCSSPHMNCCRSCTHSKYDTVTPPALQRMSGMTKMSDPARMSSASGSVGPFAPSARMRHSAGPRSPR